jgi:hypothetical protein
MQTIAFLGVQCLSCKSLQVSLLGGDARVPHACACHAADAPVEQAKLVMHPAESGEGFTFEMIVASAAYVAAVMGMVVL